MEFQDYCELDVSYFGGDQKAIDKKGMELVKNLAQQEKWKNVEEGEGWVTFKTGNMWFPGEFIQFQNEISEGKLKITLFGTDDQPIFNNGRIQKRFEMIKTEIPKRYGAFLKSIENQRQNSNIQVINTLKANTNALIVNTELTSALKDIQNNLEQSQLPNTLKILGYYKEQVSNHNILIGDLNSVDFHKVPDTEIESTTKGLEIYGTLVGLLEASILSMFKCAKEGDLIEFYEFYNNFESMGLFMTTGEKAVIQGINDINNNLNSVVAGIGILATGMFNMSSQLSAMSSQLADIKSGIDVNNAIAAVNAYQNYQTKRALKS